MNSKFISVSLWSHTRQRFLQLVGAYFLILWTSLFMHCSLLCFGSVGYGLLSFESFVLCHLVNATPRNSHNFRNFITKRTAGKVAQRNLEMMLILLTSVQYLFLSASAFAKKSGC